MNINQMMDSIDCACTTICTSDSAMLNFYLGNICQSLGQLAQALYMLQSDWSQKKNLEGMRLQTEAQKSVVRCWKSDAKNHLMQNCQIVHQQLLCQEKSFAESHPEQDSLGQFVLMRNFLSRIIQRTEELSHFIEEQLFVVHSKVSQK